MLGLALINGLEFDRAHWYVPKGLPGQLVASRWPHRRHLIGPTDTSQKAQQANWWLPRGLIEKAMGLGLAQSPLPV